MTAKTFTESTSVGKKLARARDLKLQIDSLTNELDAIKAHLLGYASDRQIDSLTLGAFTVSRRVRHTWTYSDSLEARINAIKNAQKREQLLGVAVDKPSEHVVLTFNARILAQTNYANLQELA